MRFVTSKICLSVALTSIVSCSAFLSMTVSAAQAASLAGRSDYYGADFLQSYQSHSLKDQALLESLFRIIQGGHIRNSGAPDSIYENCAGRSGGGVRCVQHRTLGYDNARKILFGTLFLENIGGVFGVKDVYCERTFTDRDFYGKKSIGPGLIPIDGNILNTEHTWPQSRFTGRFDEEMQKSDLHHLFPSDSEMNSHRSSLRFGNVVHDVEKLKCPIGRLGQQKEGGIIFEAPMNHRGNVARAIFYFATRYRMKISEPEEAALRQWNEQDPVDAAEMKRNDLIEESQGNRNPFIDIPDLLSHISSFR